MKLTIGFLLFCALYAAVTAKSTVVETTSPDGISARGLELVLGKLEQMDRKLLNLQIELTEHREEMKRNRDCVTSTAAPPEQESTTPTTTTSKPLIHSSCKEEPSKVSGVYLIRVNNDSTPFNVYCEQASFGGGWLVVQHRFDGSVDFYRNWDQYREGFGEVDNEFWLGLERMHQLTTARPYELIVEMKDFKGNYGYTRYIRFQVGSESEKYELTLGLGLDSGRAGDGFDGFHNGVKFSTKDRDNDETPDKHFAVRYTGAWWYCPGGGVTNLNGPYKNSDDTWNSTVWYHFKADLRALSFTRMMIREL
ncbi:angiopoietin-4-like [Anopheles darlingi]|uniref:angiopoietin-4-like n=1 Tax=Anopheles darlingi TaxID=43151 RepID=UPI00210050D5|nr:angiopoietin-4-like [Anopheles darlingi]